jgi:hypothetical protein
MSPVSAADRLFDNAFHTYTGDDTQAFRAAMKDYGQSDHGQAWDEQQQAFSQSMREQEWQDALQQAAFAEQQRQEQTRRGPVMSR